MKVQKLKIVDDGTDEFHRRQNIRTCLKDIKNKNRDNEHLHSPSAKLFANGVLEQARGIYTRSMTYLNYRQGFIAVKVENVTREDKVQFARQIEAFEEYCTNAGCKVKQFRKHTIIEVRGFE